MNTSAQKQIITQCNDCGITGPSCTIFLLTLSRLCVVFLFCRCAKTCSFVCTMDKHLHTLASSLAGVPVFTCMQKCHVSYCMSVSTLMIVDMLCIEEQRTSRILPHSVRMGTHTHCNVPHLVRLHTYTHT
jgi:hypothetical protein